MLTTCTAGRAPIFTEEAYARAAIKSFTLPNLVKDHDFLCWVLMPDHAHWLVRLGQQSSLTTLVGCMKAASARYVRRAGYPRPVWAAGFHDRILREQSQIPIVTRYILNNPVKAGLVRHAEQYMYRSKTP